MITLDIIYITVRRFYLKNRKYPSTIKIHPINKQNLVNEANSKMTFLISKELNNYHFCGAEIIWDDSIMIDEIKLT